MRGKTKKRLEMQEKVGYNKKENGTYRKAGNL